MSVAPLELQFNSRQVGSIIARLGDKVRENPKAYAEHSLVFFCIHYLSAHFYNGFAEFQKVLFKYLEDLKPNVHSLILIAREHGKSTLFTLAFVIWCSVYRKKINSVIVSSVRETSEAFLANIKKEIESNGRLIADFGDLTGDSAKQRRPNRVNLVELSNKVYIAASSCGANIRGLVRSMPEDLERDTIVDPETGEKTYIHVSVRPDLVVCDDILDDRRVMTPQVRDRTYDWFFKALFPAVHSDRGNIILVGTTLHDDDLVSRLWRDKVQTYGWFKKKMPACNPETPFDDDGNPVDCLFPEKWGKVDYNRPYTTTDPFTGKETTKYYSKLWWRSRELGPAFGSEFLLQPMNDQTRFFVRSDFNWYVLKSPQLTPRFFQVCVETTGKALEYLPNDLICVTTMDPGATDERHRVATTDPDYTVVCTTGYSPTHRKFYLVSVNRARMSPFDMMRTLLMHLQLFSRQYGAKYVPNPDNPNHVVAGLPFTHIGLGIESVAFQKVMVSLIEELTVSLGMYPPVIEIKRGSGASKVMRAMMPAALCKNGNLVFPFLPPVGIEAAESEVDACLAELCEFPQSTHDDFVDAFSDGINLLHSYSIALGRGLSGIQAMVEIMQGSYGFSMTPERLEMMEQFMRQSPGMVADPVYA